jgi:SNF2 family DNA or RNA helicase
MIILHAGLVGDQTILWAEEAIAGREALPLGVSRTPEQRAGGMRHPFSAPYERLIQVVNESSANFQLNGHRVTAVRAWLPSTDRLPVPSSRLLCADDEQPEKSAKLLPWLIYGILMRDVELANLLANSESSHILLPGVILGSEISYLAQLARYASALVARQQYLPGIIQKEGRYFAHWPSILTPEDHATISTFAQMMPHVVQALDVVQLSALPPNLTPLQVVTRYLDAYVDQSARMAASKVINNIAIRNNTYLSVHDCWLHALSSPTGEMNFDLIELGKFATQVEDWQQPILSNQFAQFRLCFRLEEPFVDEFKMGEFTKGPGSFVIPANDNWNVQYLLQDVKDQSLLIPAEEAWRNSGKVKKTFAASNFRPREQLLRSLGQAARLSNDVNESLKAATPEGFSLTNTAAFNFLTETAPTLEQAGFGVMLPSWWRKGKRSKIKRKANVNSTMKLKGKLTMDKIVEFDWEMALGDITLTEDELQTLAALKTPLVNIRGQWILVSSDDIQSAIDFLQKKAKNKTTLGELVKLAFTKTTSDGAEIEVSATGWIGEFLHKLNQPEALQELPTPARFVGQLRPYQQRGFSWLHFLSEWGLGACLADDMGLGKTIQTLAMIQKRKDDGESRPVLLVCPTSVVNNWRKEALKFTPNLSVLVHHGAKRKKGDHFIQDANQSNVVISTYSLLDRDRLHLNQIDWAGVILDEAQNIKNDLTKQSKAARDLNSHYRIALTGTPVENTVGDLFSLMHFLNPDFLGTSTTFRKHFLYPIQVAKDPEARERLKSMTQPFILRRLKTDKSIISDLPEKMEMKVYCSLTKEQVTLYSAVLEDLEQKLVFAEGSERGGLVLSTLSRLKQVCNHPAHFNGDNSGLDGRSGKLDRLVEMIDEVLQSGEKALIFSQFAEMGKLIKQHLQEKFGVEVLFLHGGVSKTQRDDMVERFQTADGPPLFMLSLKAGGTGLNLTAANHVFHFDRWWNPAVENQASDRAFRIGQKKNVQVRKFISAGTLEDKIDEIIDDKQRIADVVVGSGEGWLSSLSNEDLKRVLTLSKEAFVE